MVKDYNEDLETPAEPPENSEDEILSDSSDISESEDSETTDLETHSEDVDTIVERIVESSDEEMPYKWNDEPEDDFLKRTMLMNFPQHESTFPKVPENPDDYTMGTERFNAFEKQTF